MLPEGVPNERTKAKIMVQIYSAEGLPKSKNVFYLINEFCW